MPVKTVRFYTLALVVADAIAILGAFSLAYIWRVQWDPRPLVENIGAAEFISTFLLLTPFWLLAFWALGLYSPRVYRKRLTEYGKLFLGSCIGILIVLGYSFVMNEAVFPARLVAVYALGLVFVLLVIMREILRLINQILFWYGVGVSNVMIVGNGAVTKDMIANLSDTRHSGIRVVAVVNRKKDSGYENVAHFRSLKSAMEMLRELRIDSIVQTELYEEPERNQRIMGAAQNAHINYFFIPGEPEFYSGKNQVDVFLGYPIIQVHQTPLAGWGQVVKRVFDTLIVLIFSPIWVPIFLLLMLLQKILNPGPIFFKQTRLGRYKKKFGVYKFRSMNPKYSGQDAITIFRKMGRDDLADEYAVTRKVENDPRITWFGKFLRKTSLDEVAQILNIIRGDMSLVGPRPILPDELPFYRGRGALLLSVKPGLTGLWQVSGRSDLPFDKRVDLELYYAQNWSFWMDMKILFKTIGVVVFRRGAK